MTTETGINDETRQANRDWQIAQNMTSIMGARYKNLIKLEQAAYRRFWCLRLPELKSMPYKDYLLTPEWDQIRERSLIIANRICESCKAADVALHVHHKTYERRGEEHPDDLVVLCKDCHQKVHDITIHERN